MPTSQVARNQQPAPAGVDARFTDTANAQPNSPANAVANIADKAQSLAALVVNTSSDTPSDSAVERESLSFASSDGSSTIAGYVWQSADIAHRAAVPRGVVLLVHGMAEHIERYDEFARFLARAGYIVCGHNQIGHGSSSTPEHWGEIPLDGGRMALVRDVGRLRTMAATYCDAGTPMFVFGHSMGSFVVRNYIALYGDGLAGAILCGTGFVSPATSRAGRGVARLIAKTRGENYRSALLHSMAEGAYSRAIPSRRTDLDWLSVNEENVDRYLADEQCGFMFSAGGYATLTDLTAEVCTLECAQRVPRSLPLLYISGAEDPVGDDGRGVFASAELAKRAGSVDVTCKLYDGMRHEILNETGHELVFNDIRKWLDLKGGQAGATVEAGPQAAGQDGAGADPQPRS